MKFLEMDIPKQSFIYGAIHLLAKRLQTLGDKIDPTISSKQWLLLAVISKFDDTPPNIGNVAEVFGSSRQNVKKMANILEKKGLLKMGKDEKDLRSIQLSLTEKCGVYFRSRAQMEAEMMGRIFSDIDDDMLDALCEGMTVLAKNIDTLLEENKNAKK